MNVYILVSCNDEGLDVVMTTRAFRFCDALDKLGYYPFDLKEDFAGNVDAARKRARQFYSRKSYWPHDCNEVDGDSRCQYNILELTDDGSIIIHGPARSQA